MQPTLASTIDFSNYSDEQLENSLASINRDKFEQNYLACLAEIQKRKSENRWKIIDVEAAKAKLQKIQKITRGLALMQALGGLLGIFNYINSYGPSVLDGKVPPFTIIIIMILICLFALTTWAAWRYWKHQQDQHSLWRTLIYLQIPSFSIGGLGYGFYSGFTAPLGFDGVRFGITATLGSNAALVWNPQVAAFHFTINLGAIALLVLLSQATRK